MTLIPESSLVAMCVMDSFDPDLVRSDKLWRIQESWRDSTMKSPRTNEEKELEAAIEKHLKEFESWPTDKERRIYLEITAGLRVN